MTTKNDNIGIDSPIYTVAQLRKRWGCTQGAVLQAIHEGRLVAFRIGRRVWRIRLDEIERFERTTKVA